MSRYSREEIDKSIAEIESIYAGYGLDYSLIIKQLLTDQDRICAIFNELCENAPTSIGFIYLCDKYRVEIEEITA